MAIKLGSWLLGQRWVTREQLEEALDAQVLDGGRLGTNLVELGHLPEQRLADALHHLHRLPTAHGEVQPHEQALTFLKPEWCDQHNILPLRLEGRTLYLGVITPYSGPQADELGRRLGLTVSQVVLPEFRMNQLLRKHAHAFRPVRPIDFSHAATGTAEKAKAELSRAELMSEEEFQSLYAQALTGGRAHTLDDASADLDVVIDATDVVEETPLIVPQPQAPVAPLERRDPGSVPLPPEEDRRGRPAPRAAPAVLLTPISFKEAQAALKQTEGREDVARVVMRFAASKFPRALLLNVARDVAMGWQGVGASIAGERAKKVAVSLLGPSPFKLVRDSRSHFLGPMKRDGAVNAFFKVVGGASQTSILMPILARGRVVNILYCDSGPDRPAYPDIGELLIVAQSVGRSYEALLAKRARAE